MSTERLVVTLTSALAGPLALCGCQRQGQLSQGEVNQGSRRESHCPPPRIPGKGEGTGAASCGRTLIIQACTHAWTDRKSAGTCSCALPAAPLCPQPGTLCFFGDQSGRATQLPLKGLLQKPVFGAWWVFPVCTGTGPRQEGWTGTPRRPPVGVMRSPLAEVFTFSNYRGSLLELGNRCSERVRNLSKSLKLVIGGQDWQLLLSFGFLRRGLTMQPRLASNSQQSSCLSLPSAGITGVHHHTQIESPVFLDNLRGSISAVPQGQMCRGGRKSVVQPQEKLLLGSAVGGAGAWGRSDLAFVAHSGLCVHSWHPYPVLRALDSVTLSA